MRKVALCVMVLVLVAGCATSRQMAIGFGVGVKVSAETARDTVKVLYAHKLIEDDVYNQAKIIYGHLEELSKEYRDVLNKWPGVWPWAPRDVVAVQKEIQDLLDEWQRFVATMPVKAPTE